MKNIYKFLIAIAYVIILLTGCKKQDEELRDNLIGCLYQAPKGNGVERISLIGCVSYGTYKNMERLDNHGKLFWHPQPKCKCPTDIVDFKWYQKIM